VITLRRITPLSLSVQHWLAMQKTHPNFHIPRRVRVDLPIKCLHSTSTIRNYRNLSANLIEAILESLGPTITEEIKKEIVTESKLSHWLKCSSLLLPAVVWFGEPLSQNMFDETNAWIDEEKKPDLMLVIGTMAQVYPAATFVERAKENGVKVVAVNLDGEHTGGIAMRKQDWMFAGNVEEVLEVLFEGVLLND
jgi:NAD-dependent deacetylase sirtuin 5